MSVNLFFTLPARPPGAGPQNAGPGTALPAFGSGAGFLDLILQRMAETQQQAPTKDESTPLSSDNPLLDKNPKLDLAAILANTPEIAEQVARDTDTFDLDVLTQIADALALNQQIFDEKLNPELANGLVALKVTPENLPRVRNILETLAIGGNPTHADETALNEFMTRLEEMVTSDETASIVINLTPEQINRINETLKALRAEASAQEQFTAEQIMAMNAAKNSDENEETDPAKLFAAFFAGFVNILPPKAQAAPFQTPAAEHAQAPAKAPDDIAAKLKALFVGETDASEGEFKDLIQQYTGNKPKADNPTGDVGAKLKAPAPLPDLSLLQNWPFQGSITALPGSLEDSAEFMPLNAAPVTGTAAMTSLVTQAPSAGAPHPAVQIIASAIQKNGSGGENRNFTLQLDPPELGRIEVRMEFSKDKITKTHMVIEKPETFVMLQRDGHALERSLQEIGLDGGDHSLSFELATQDHEFSQNGRHEGGGNGGGASAADEREVIESTMTWFVDPETGHMRYDFVV